MKFVSEHSVWAETPNIRFHGNLFSSSGDRDRQRATTSQLCV